MKNLIIAALIVTGSFVSVAHAADTERAKAIIAETAQRHGISVPLALAIGKVESSYDCAAVGGVGELGPMQVRPQTARGVGVYGNLRDCRVAVEASMRYLKMAIARNGASCAGISGYNRGIYAKPVCTSYGRKVFAALGRTRVADND